ncbi:GMP synthase-like glutamine amidotransferase [Actinoalloteichus hoggarensis]|uniref:GMP synthase [glutamine-hydrolyzing] n=1 Tax=Actinoalloteichus hoggarensis TaxID=1470176 RepID=A0A221W9D7_9PSEU|nr:type 1 glutamine amidotransferase [Actinoalloteichus hoggarensis]ASO22226.1 GMP synthase [glutamine-hydrolyzing] [Actinoalloteichus hoggarensis]MBB5923689.1 GMP synthase-like glutamine amidotransferase [Actinoalloteichus hoggarensis]
MAKARILILQPAESDSPGVLADWLTDAGADLQVVRADREAIPTLDDFHALIVLGGPMSAESLGEHPWLVEVRARLTEGVRRRLPTLGICLGAQLLASVSGGMVEPGEDGPEVGARLVAKRDAAEQDALLEDLPLTPLVMQAHGDVITELPPGAQRLAASPKYENQAFRVGDLAYGFQFHIETSPEVVRAWLADSEDFAAALPATQWEPGRLEEAHEEIAQTWQPIMARFATMAGQQAGLVPGSPGRRRLPLL